jgi:hypothetical protein
MAVCFASSEPITEILDHIGGTVAWPVLVVGKSVELHIVKRGFLDQPNPFFLNLSH